MIFRTLDSSGDWTFGKGIGNYARDEKAVDFNIQTRILSWLGDCFFAPEEGVDWQSRLDVGQQDALEEELTAMIAGSYGVMNINSVDIDFNRTTRNVVFTYDVQTIFSDSFQRQLIVASGAA